MADAVRANNTKSLIGDPRDIFIALGVILTVVLIVIPLPTILLDTFMALNLVLALLILLIVLYTQKATDFSLFPTVLLVVTVFGLALNICSTRLILTQGAAFDGRMIRAFATFVVGSGGTEGLVVGFVIFIVIIAVQVVVITKGATRVSEVAARFTLDALPGKQMAIEAELNSQSITEEEARRRKQELQQEVDFYGAMDGASKFISGNVKVGIFITVLNALGGVIIGSLMHGEPLLQAVGTYVSFTIGDGLLSQFPALLVSTAMGIVVTRSASPGSIGEAVSVQFTRDARIYWICAVVLFGFALLPGFPWYVLIPMGILIGFYAYTISMKQRKKAQFDAMMAKSAEKKPKDENGEMSPVVPLDTLSLELGYGLIPLVDKDKGAELLERVQGIRRQSALELGLVIPKIRIIDNMLLEPAEYCFKIRGVESGRGSIRLGYYLCINPGTVREELPGEKTKDPTFGLPAIWISEDKRDEAERAGYTVVDPPSIIATHLTEIIKSHASEILGRQETQAILDTLRKEYPALVEEAQSQKALSLGEIQKVLQGLLKEQVSIRNMVTILEALADFAPITRDVRFLTEKARQALGRQICFRYADENHILRVLTIDPALEQKIIESRVETGSGGVIAALDPAVQNAWISSLARSVAAVQERGWFPIIVCSESARYLVKISADRELPELAVLSVPEITSDVTLEAVGVIRLDH
ncbi:MAG: flagellar biosynthesis protein FlhA [Spirochaetaceae bacterium]|jgi:flagellar biosynthesis protein FlhA|nr:flagellar biosynthesis protein FlhA [Spirochaetaceae bacterium]